MHRCSSLSWHPAVAWTAACLLMTVFASFTRGDSWPQFRGANTDGVAASVFPKTWDQVTNVRWKIPLAGEGWSCPVVWGNKLILTAAVRTDEEVGSAASRPEPYVSGGGRRRTDLTEVEYRWEILCLDTASGQLLWRRTARTGNPPLPRHSSNTFATETPVTDGERIYAYFGMTGLYCFDMDGRPLWQKDLGTFEMRWLGNGQFADPARW